MTIVVIGQITQDTLIFPHDEWRIVNELGGTLYTVSALAGLTTQPIKLICNVGQDLYEEAIATLQKLGGVEITGVNMMAGPHPRTYILYASEYGAQYDEGELAPITFTQVEPLLGDSDFVLVSPMTGFDLELQTLQQIRASVKCPIYLDYHILALARDPFGSRYVKRRRDWLDWCRCCDHLQLNRFEAQSLCSYPLSSESSLLRFAKALFRSGINSLAITLGEEGAFVGWKELGVVHYRRLDALPVPKVVDATGCGDVFAAGFIASFIKTKDYVSAFETAIRAAAIKCGLTGFGGLSQVNFAEVGMGLTTSRIPAHRS